MRPLNVGRKLLGEANEAEAELAVADGPCEIAVDHPEDLKVLLKNESLEEACSLLIVEKAFVLKLQDHRQVPIVSSHMARSEDRLMAVQEGASNTAVLSGGRPETACSACATVCPVQLGCRGRGTVHVRGVCLVRCLRGSLGQGAVDDPCLEALGVAVGQVHLVGTHDAAVSLAHFLNDQVLHALYLLVFLSLTCQ